MSPKELLQVADTELDRIAQQLIGCEPAMAQALARIEHLTDQFVALREELSSSNALDLVESLEKVLTKARRVQTLLESGTVFHCHSIFGRAETADTYSSDGTLNASQDSRIIFQG